MNEYVILLDNNNAVTINADSCEWDSDELCFYLDNPGNEADDDTVVAMFKMEHIVGYFRKTYALTGGQNNE